MTANLDGETNLKTHVAPAATRQYQTPEHLASDLNAVIECENPNADLGRFIGRIKLLSDPPSVNNNYGTSSSSSSSSGYTEVNVNNRAKSIGLSFDNIVLRGTELKNTEYVYGCAVYTGEDTKMSKNSKLTANKFSTVEKSMNKYLIFFLALKTIIV